MSKKQKNALNKAKRKDWGVINPITRKSESKLVYNRKNRRNQDDSCDFVYEITAQ